MDMYSYRYGNPHNGILLVSHITKCVKPPDNTALPHPDSRERQIGGSCHYGSEHPERWNVGCYGELVVGVGEPRGAVAGVGY
jgi:hypothetical protein